MLTIISSGISADSRGSHQITEAIASSIVGSTALKTKELPTHQIFDCDTGIQFVCVHHI